MTSSAEPRDLKGASIAHAHNAAGEAGLPGQLFAPSAARNTQPIVDLIASIVATFPAETGHNQTTNALELASGTGQHIVALAKRLPQLNWQPSEITASRLASIQAYMQAAALPNLLPAQTLDATIKGWSQKQTPKALIYLANLLHLISAPEARTLIDEAAQSLAPKGQLLLYGPFMRNHTCTSPGDARFHASLIAQDASIGYKDAADIISLAQNAGLKHLNTHMMPANNLALQFENPA
ncbi:MAG: DUF938 domain-containing protein [Cognatishimia sp.]